MTVKVFISVPAIGKSADDIISKRNDILDKLGRKTCPNIFLDKGRVKPTMDYLQISTDNVKIKTTNRGDPTGICSIPSAISDIKRCDFVVFACGYSDDARCVIEKNAQEMLGKSFVYESDLD